MLLVAMFIIGGFIEAHTVLRRSPRVQETLDAQHVSRLILERLGADAPLTHVDSPFADIDERERIFAGVIGRLAERLTSGGAGNGDFGAANRGAGGIFN